MSDGLDLFYQSYNWYKLFAKVMSRRQNAQLAKKATKTDYDKNKEPFSC